MPITQPSYPIRTDDLVSHIGGYVDAKLDLSLLDYTGIDRNGGTDMAAKINTAGADAAALAIAQGWDCVNVTFPKGDYKINSFINFYDRVRWVLDDAHIFAGANFASVHTGMFVSNAPGSAPVAAVAQGSGDTTNGDYVIRNVTSPELWDDSMRVAGTNIPANAYVLLSDINKKYIVIDKPCTGTGTVALTKAATWYGRFRNCGIIGGTIDPNGFRTGALVRFQFSEGFLMENTTLLQNRPTDGTDFNWAIALMQARDFVIDRPTIIGGEAVYEDGVHVSGIRGRIISPYVESGDDAIAIGEEGTMGGVSTMLVGSRYIDVVNPVVKSNRGYAVKVYALTSNVGPISDIVVTGMTGRAGVLRNGGIHLTNDEALNLGSHRIRNIQIDGQLEIASLAFDASSGGTNGIVSGLTTPPDPSGPAPAVYIARCDEVYINVKFKIEQPLSPAVPMSSVYNIIESEGVTLGPKSAGLEVTRGNVPLYAINNAPKFAVESDGRVGSPSRALRHVVLDEDFLGRSIDTVQWATHVGTDGDCLASLNLSAGSRGTLLLQTGNDVAATMATNGAQIDGSLNWANTHGIQAQGLEMEAVVRIQGATLNHVGFVGYTDQNSALEMPFTLVGGTLTANATDAVGFLFDSSATVPDRWYGVAVIGGVAMTPLSLGATSYTTSVPDRLSLYVRSNGKIDFVVNNANGSARASSPVSSGPTALLCPVAAVHSRGSVIRFLEVDKIVCRMQRAI